jgi:ATP-dependent RNA helicase RhlE
MRLYDLVLSNVLRLKLVKKLVIDEVDMMLDFGYKTQVKNIFEYLRAKRQNILFSATMTTYVDTLIGDFLINPVKKTISVSGTPLESISQECYNAPNFYTKANLLNYLLTDKEKYSKVLIFVSSKANADRLFKTLDFQSEISVIHAGKEQNHRTKSIENFASGRSRILIATDVISRGIDIEKVNQIKFDYELAKSSLHFYQSTSIPKIEDNNIPKEVSNLKFISNLVNSSPIDSNLDELLKPYIKDN